MRICADCSNQIRRNDKFRMDGSTLRHVNCSNPRMVEARLPLWDDQPLRGSWPTDGFKEESMTPVSEKGESNGRSM